MCSRPASIGVKARLAVVSTLAIVASMTPAHAGPASDLALLFSDLCIATRLSPTGLEAAFQRVTHGEKPLERIEADRETVYSREIRIGEVAFVLQAIKPARANTFRSCRVSAEFPNAETVEAEIDRMFPAARRTAPTVQRKRIGPKQLLVVTGHWIAPRPGIASIELTVEIFGDRRKAALTGLPPAP